MKPASRRFILLGLVLPLLATLPFLNRYGRIPAAQTSVGIHEPLRIVNTFKTAEEVVRYYAARDASGFVWSGLLDTERQSFTTWKEVPEHDSFLVASRYEVIPIEERHGHDEASIEVRYNVLGIGDGQGTLVPADQPIHRVRFDLKRIQGKWKIVSPVPQNVSPVVLESKFPVVSWAP